MKDANKNRVVPMANNDICSIENPCGAIDFYMPLPDEVYQEWKREK
ncbi:MAG: hypothetical protein GX119_09650 [Syntrophomonadaceae bacterium]|nr:hypothetical protein [Syntrophomonadaceae bacterium]